jgi:hypothetical protein
MRRTHVVTVAVLIGVAAALGTYAATRTSDLGVQARKSSDQAVGAQIAAKTKQLDALETSLRRALASKPPALPKLPKLLPAPQPAPRVTYSVAPPARQIASPAAPVSSARSTAQSAGHGDQEHQQSSSGGEHDD